MEERRAKVARPKGTFFGQFPGFKSSPESGPDFGPGIRAQFWDRNPGPKSGPDSGLQIGAAIKFVNRAGRKSVPDSGPEIGPGFRSQNRVRIPGLKLSPDSGFQIEPGIRPDVSVFTPFPGRGCLAMVELPQKASTCWQSNSAGERRRDQRVIIPGHRQGHDNGQGQRVYALVRLQSTGRCLAKYVACHSASEMDFALFRIKYLKTALHVTVGLPQKRARLAVSF